MFKGLPVNWVYRRLLLKLDLDPRPHRDFSAAVVYDVTVLAIRHPGVELPVQLTHGKESLVSSREAEIFVSSLPVVNPRPHHSVGELDHVHDGGPAVLAHPAITTTLASRVRLAAGWTLKQRLV